MFKIRVSLGAMVLALCAPSIHAAGLVGDSVAGELAISFVDPSGTLKIQKFDYGNRVISNNGTNFNSGTVPVSYMFFDDRVVLNLSFSGRFGDDVVMNFRDNTRAIPGIFSVTSTNIGGLTNDRLSTQGNNFSINLSSLPINLSSTATFTLNPLVSAVPEPESYALLLAGMALVAAVARRRKTGLAFC